MGLLLSLSPMDGIVLAQDHLFSFEALLLLTIRVNVQNECSRNTLFYCSAEFAYISVLAGETFFSTECYSLSSSFLGFVFDRVFVSNFSLVSAKRACLCGDSRGLGIVLPACRFQWTVGTIASNGAFIVQIASRATKSLRRPGSFA